MSELKPCPFCGGEASLLLNAKRKIYGKDEYRTGLVACCNVCEARMFYGSEKLAIEAWNRRTVTMADLIDRQAAIDAADRVIERDKSGNNDVVKAMKAWVQYIERLPSAQPERKTGKWLDGNRIGYGWSLYWYIYCSECLYERDDDNHDKDTPYCPNCGVSMAGVEDDGTD